jgi:hypothetical protein
MKLSRQGFIAVLLLTAVGYAFFAPLLPMHGVAARHHFSATSIAALSFASLSLHATSSFFSSTVPDKRALHPQGLIELHCTRLC